jgi:hypothetical protein
MVHSHPHLPNALLQEGAFQIQRILKFTMHKNFTIICNILGYEVLYAHEQFTKYSLNLYHTTEMLCVCSPTGTVSHFFQYKRHYPKLQ